MNDQQTPVMSAEVKSANAVVSSELLHDARGAAEPPAGSLRVDLDTRSRAGRLP
jgi:hypothetical protein